MKVRKYIDRFLMVAFVLALIGLIPVIVYLNYYGLPNTGAAIYLYKDGTHLSKQQIEERKNILQKIKDIKAQHYLPDSNLSPGLYMFNKQKLDKELYPLYEELTIWEKENGVVLKEKNTWQYRFISSIPLLRDLTAIARKG